MEDKITLDRETFRALAVDTRIEILKKLDDEYQLTLTDLSERLELAPSTIKEHLERLVEVGLIEQIDKGTKWKYYRLTKKGKQLLNPYEKKVWIILSAAMLLFFAALYRLIYRLNELLSFSMPTEGEVKLVADHASEATVEAPGAGFFNAAVENVTTSTKQVMREAVDEVSTTVSSTIPVEAVAESAAGLPYAELTITLILVLVAGICVGYLIKKKRII